MKKSVIIFILVLGLDSLAQGQSSSSTQRAPGQVPIGGMVAVMPSLTNAWQPPAHNVIKDGFMLADGGIVPSCSGCGIPSGTGIPDMTDKYPKGALSGGGSTNSSNTKDISHTHIIYHTHQALTTHDSFDVGLYGLTIIDTSDTGFSYLTSNVSQIAVDQGNRDVGGYTTTSMNSGLVGDVRFYTSGVLSPPTGTNGTGARSSSGLSTVQNFEPYNITVIWVIRVK